MMIGELQITVVHISLALHWWSGVCVCNSCSGKNRDKTVVTISSLLTSTHSSAADKAHLVFCPVHRPEGHLWSRELWFVIIFTSLDTFSSYAHPWKGVPTQLNFKELGPKFESLLTTIGQDMNHSFAKTLAAFPNRARKVYWLREELVTHCYCLATPTFILTLVGLSVLCLPINCSIAPNFQVHNFHRLCNFAESFRGSRKSC